MDFVARVGGASGARLAAAPTSSDVLSSTSSIVNMVCRTSRPERAGYVVPIAFSSTALRLRNNFTLGNSKGKMTPQRHGSG